jgi:regulator of cell morphogenesis and NO signaling
MSKSTIDPEAGVGELVARLPRTARVFERYRIDYCCGGKQTLRAACATQGVDLAEVRGRLEEAERAPPARGEETFANASLGVLVRHIIDTFHDPLRAELPRLSGLLTKVRAAHERRHPELIARLNEHFHDLKNELLPHLEREERVLFPFVLRLEEARASGFEPRRPPFGTVANPVKVMEGDHDSVARSLRSIRAVTKDFTLPEGACASFKALYTGLEDLERDLTRHIHLENNLLHPRALELELARPIPVPA